MHSQAPPPLMTTAPKSGGKSPHCKVCGDESSGFHYGVDSCEGCKGFFRRCITQGMTHKCANEEKCEITPFTRNSCQYCRLKKCFSVGMSREASRLGRRPKRLKDVSGDSCRSQLNLPIAPYPSPAELYRLRMAELQKLLQANGTFKSELMQAFLSAAQASFREHAKNTTITTGTTNKTVTTHAPMPDPNQNTYGTGMIQFGNESGYSSMSSPASSKSQSPLHDNQQQQQQMLNTGQMMDNNNMNTLSPTSNFNNNPMIPQQHPQHLGIAGQHMGNNNNVPPGQMMNMSPPMASPSSMTTNVMAMPYILSEEGTLNIKTEPGTLTSCQSQDSNGNSASEVLRLLDEVKQQPSDTRMQLITQVQEAVGTAHLSTCRNIFDSVVKARVEIDEKQRAMPPISNVPQSAGEMFKGFVSQMVPEITNVVRFCKKLPGFSEVDQEDQIKLIKQGSFEVLIARFSMLVDCNTEEMLDPSFQMKCPKTVVLSMPMGNFFEEFYKVAAEINPLCLTDEEIGMYTACLIICPDRIGLKNLRAVYKIQHLYLQALFLMLSQHHSDPDVKFLKLMTSVPVLRAINEEHSKAINNIKMSEPGTYDNIFPDLHKEVFDGKI